MMVKEFLKFSIQSMSQTPVTMRQDGDVLNGYDVVMAVAGTNMNQRYFSKDVLAELAPTFKGVPLNLDHNTEQVGAIVGYVSDAWEENSKLVGNIVLSPQTSQYKTAYGYISSRFDAQEIPNVSVGIWADVDFDEEENRYNISGGYADHLALVTHGACDPSMGCGVGIGVVDDTSDMCDCNSIDDEEIDKELLLKQILMKKIKTMEE